MGDHELNPVEEAQSERGRAIVQAAVAQTRAPLGLRERIEADRARARPARRRWALGGSFAAVAAAAVLAIVLVGGGGGAGGPSVADAAALAGRGPVAPAPAVDDTHPGLLKRSVGGVSYPSWQAKFPWHASGAREDKLDGRRAVTVFYENPQNARIGYTIVDGEPLDEPAGSGTR